jgi:hypothetical protein
MYIHFSLDNFTTMGCAFTNYIDQHVSSPRLVSGVLIFEENKIKKTGNMQIICIPLNLCVKLKDKVTVARGCSASSRGAICHLMISMSICW